MEKIQSLKKEELLVLGERLLNEKNYTLAEEVYLRLSAIDKFDVNSRVVYIKLLRINDRSAEVAVKARDMSLQLIREFPNIFNGAVVVANDLIRQTAFLCHASGKMLDAIALFESITRHHDSAFDLFHLSNVYFAIENDEKGLLCLKAAVRIDPSTYGTQENYLKISTVEAYLLNNDNNRPKIRKYPDTSQIITDLPSLITCDLLDQKIIDSSKFIADPCIFLLGACYHADFELQLNAQKIRSHKIDNHRICSCATVKMLISWLVEPASNPHKHVLAKLFPDGADAMTKKIREATHIFISFTTAYEFYERDTGLVLLDSGTILNINWLAERYEHRLAEVSQNVSDIKYIVNELRKINSTADVFLEIVPTPIHSSVGSESSSSSDFLSKANLRLSIHQALIDLGLEKIYYWPSIEIYRWVAAHHAGFFGGTDGSAWHVDFGIVKKNCKSICRCLSW